MTDPEKSAARLRRQLADRLSEEGHLTSPEWRAAVESVPRHKFLATGFFRTVPGSSPTAYAPVLPDEKSEGWLALCYADESLVTQIAGTVMPRDITGAIARLPSSSSTLPSLMVDMLESLDVKDGDHVLEIGTGTGYNAGLLAHRVGAENVTSIETDPAVAAGARHALWGCGYQVDVIAADGRHGHAKSAPYDRTIVTCGVTRVRPEWVDQTKPKGIILTTLRGGLWSSGLVKLTVSGDGTAEGGFLSEASFMRARQEEPDTNVGLPAVDDGETRRTTLGGDIAHDWTARFVIDNAMDQLFLISGVSLAGEPPCDYFLHLESASFAAVSGNAHDGYRVRQGGSVRIWDAIERAVGDWRGAGAPPVTEFRIRVTPDTHTVSLASAPHVAWVKPTRPAAAR
jgi:methyltransferase of ATP-grasp peptide maturase system